MVAALALLIFAAVFVLVFLESGADSGRLRLELAEAYAPGTVEYVGERNFFLARLPDETFLALSDLDAANRTNQQRRCRVGAIAANDPRLPRLLQMYASRFDPGVSGSSLLLREECTGAAYDLTGLRLDADGRNLDLHPVTIDARGHVVVDVSRRTCSAREGPRLAVPADC